MFDGLLKSKFYSKCKSDIKLTRTRIELIKKKRNAMQKYLRNDVADLLKNGLDINAYGRAEGLQAEMNRSSCYDFIDQCCEHISKNVSAMNKQRECPEECREAVSSIMFAAARFADLPELRELRSLFSERYGSSLDCFVNKELAEKMKSGPPSKELKLQLLQEIAAESGLEWDSKALENKLFNESAHNKSLAKETDELKHPREYDAEAKKDISRHEQKDATRNEAKERNNRSPLLYPKRHEAPPVKDIQVDTIAKIDKKANETPSVRNEENEDKLNKYKSIPPPPYTKSEANKEIHDKEDPVPKAKPIPKSVRRRPLKPSPQGREIDNSNGPEIDEKEKMKQQGQRILKFFDGGGRDEPDDEEKVMDKLLQHYSRKKASSDEKGKSVGANYKSRDRPNRIASFPVDLASPATETPKRHTRATSFQPELLQGNNGHVHPKLPDYDDFVARLASLRGNSSA